MARAKALWVVFFLFSVLVLTLLITSPVLADDGPAPDAPQAGVTATPLPDPNDSVATAAPTEVTTDAATQPVVTATDVTTDAAATDSAVEATATTDPALVTDTAEPPAATDPAAAVTVEATEVPTDEVTVTATDASTTDGTLTDLLVSGGAALTDAQGNPVPLASKDAAALAEAEDPYFIAGGVYYGYTTTGSCNPLVLPANCQPVPDNAISAAITAYNTTYASTASGPIYIESGTYNQSASITVSAVTKLTGLIGTGSSGSNSTVINFSDGFNLNVSGTTLGFTLQGLNITGNISSGSGSALVEFDGNAGTLTMTDVSVKNNNSNGDGIHINGNTGNVTLNGVHSSTNGKRGAYLTSITGNVVINNSEFDRNQAIDNSLYVKAAGTITMNGVSSSRNNNGNGAELASAKGITINNSVFEGNSDGSPYDGFGYGLYIDSTSTGPIILNNVFANNNEESNIYINQVNGSVTMSSVEAENSSWGNGIYVDNCAFSGSLCTKTLVGPVSLTDINAFFNHLTNVAVTSSGAITAVRVNAPHSYYGSSASFDNHYALAAQPVMVNNGTYDSSDLDNLTIVSKGSVTLSGVSMNYSVTGSGLVVDNTYGTGSVSLLGSLVQNQYDNQVSDEPVDGIHITSKGKVTVQSFSSNYNHGYGLYVNNSTGSGDVVINNSYTYTYGISNPGNYYILTHGAVSISNTNSVYSHATSISIDNRGAPTAKSVSLTNVYLSENYSDPLVIFSKGLITLNNVSSSDDNASTVTYGGIYLNNIDGNAGVTILKSSAGYNLQCNGITIVTNGAVYIDTITAVNNILEGVDIQNDSGPATPVTIKNADIERNQSTGLRVQSKGLITLTSAYIYQNNLSDNLSQYGVILTNTSSTSGTAGIVVNGTASQLNEITNNNNEGLLIYTNGPVTISYAIISNNPGGNGLDINDSGSGAVSISYVTAEANGSYGISVSAKGNVTITNPQIIDNQGGIGLYVTNTGGSGSVTIQGVGTICQNYWGSCEIRNNHNGADTAGYGVYVMSNGAVTLKNLDISESPQDGVHIDNSGGMGAVMLSKVSASNLQGYGAWINSRGAVTITSGTFDEDTNGGLYIDNHTGTAKAVIITGVETETNQSDGIHIISNGAVTLTSITSTNTYNTANGIYVDNTSSGTAGVTLTSTSTTVNQITNNNGYGVQFITNGPIAIKGARFVQNSLDNINLVNLTSTGSVSFSNIQVYESTTGYGIYLRSAGAVTMTGVDAESNSLTNVDIDNSGGMLPVVITNCVFESSNLGDGLDVVSQGAITLTNSSAKDNTSGYGASLNNVGSGLLTPPGITVQNSGTLMNKFYNNHEGLYIYASGFVKVINTDAEVTNNAIYISENYAGGTVTVTNVYGISSNLNGITIHAHGPIVGTNVTGKGYYFNDSFGIMMDNCNQSGPNCTTSGNVTLTNVTANNSGNGLYVASNGNILVKNLTANNNGSSSGSMWYGAYLDNSVSTGTPTVTIQKATANDNNDSGIFILSKGNVFLDGITACANYNNVTGGGVVVENSFGTGNGNVTITALTGANVFNDNYYDGLKIDTNGAISITNATANGNYHDGLNLVTSTTGKAITLNTIYTKHNWYHGIEAYATADSTFTAVKAFDNGFSGGGYSGVSVSTGGHNFRLVNSFLNGNSTYGLEAYIGSSQTAHIITSFFFGNWATGGTDLQDLYSDGHISFS